MVHGSIGDRFWDRSSHGVVAWVELALLVHGRRQDVVGTPPYHNLQPKSDRVFVASKVVCGSLFLPKHKAASSGIIA